MGVAAEEGRRNGMCGGKEKAVRDGRDAFCVPRPVHTLSLPFSHVLSSSSNPLVELSIHSHPCLSAELRAPGEQGLYIEPLAHVLTYSRCSVKSPGAL